MHLVARQPLYPCSLRHQSPVFEPKTCLGFVLSTQEQCIFHSPFGHLQCVSGSVIWPLFAEACLGGRPFSGLCLLRLPDACASEAPQISIPKECPGAFINLGFSQSSSHSNLTSYRQWESTSPSPKQSHEKLCKSRRKCLPVP